MKFGMPTLMELTEIEDCAALCRQLGLDFIELNMNLPQYQTENVDVKRFKRVADKYGIYYTIHLDENFNPWDFNSLVADAYTETALNTIELAKALSAPIINMHMAYGVYFTLPGERVYLFDRYKEHYLNKTRILVEKCAQAIGDSDIIFSAENCEGFSSYQLAALELMLGCEKFKLTLDIGHLARAYMRDEAFYLKNEKDLKHMHIHDIKERNPHLALGDGDLDIIKYIKLGNNTTSRMVLETKTVEGLKKSAGWLSSNVL